MSRSTPVQTCRGQTGYVTYIKFSKSTSILLNCWITKHGLVDNMKGLSRFENDIVWQLNMIGICHAPNRIISQLRVGERHVKTSSYESVKKWLQNHLKLW